MPITARNPGVKFYTHLSDRYAPFHTKVIAATASEAAHVLDGLLYHQSEVAARRHHTDGGGDLISPPTIEIPSGRRNSAPSPNPVLQVRL